MDLNSKTESELQDIYLQAQKRLQSLQQDKYKIDARYQSIEEKFLLLEKEAKENFGTSDPEELEKLALELKEKNEKELRKYLRDIEEFEKVIKEANALLNI